MKSILLLTITVLFWALNFYFGKIMMEYVSPNVAAFWRYLIGVLALLGMSFTALPSWKIIKENLFGILLVGFVGLFGFVYLFFQGLNLTSEMNGALIVSLNPAMTLLLAVCLQGYKANSRQIIGIVLAFIGIVYLLTKGDLQAILAIDFNKGDLILITGTSLFALQNIWIKKYSANLGNLSFTSLTNLCCLVGFICLLPFESAFPMATLPSRFWIAAFGMGIPGTALAYYFWNYALNDIGAARGAVFLNAIPMFTALFAVFFGASIFPYHFYSALLIIGGLLLVQKS